MCFYRTGSKSLYAQAWPGLDVAKFLALITIIFAHSLIYINTLNQGNTLITDNSFFTILNLVIVTALFAFMFPAMAGSTFYHIIQSAIPFRSILGISIFLYIVGAITSAICWGLGAIISWNILQFIALAFMVTWLISQIPG